MSRYGYLLALAGLITGCEQDIEPPHLQLAQSDAGKPLALTVGSEFMSLTLPATHSTGFTWQWAPDHLAQLQCLELHGDPVKVAKSGASRRARCSGAVRPRSPERVSCICSMLEPGSCSLRPGSLSYR